LLLAAGRKANFEHLGLDRAGVELHDGRIVSDAGLRTTNRRIYVCGDVAGSYQFTHLAEHHAGIILRRAVFRLFRARPSTVVPWCTYTDPELARVGLSETEARQRNVAHEVYRFPFEEIDRARIDDELEGFAKIITGPRGRLLGAAIVGARAGELIHEYALALGKRMTAANVASTIHVYPTYAQINRRVAEQRLKAALTPSSKAWIKRIFRLQQS
jgi:pyruvate/2-oxoglutarate dehydrogenase complex dihydrolipoamide dehydrogenase (E3) component